MGNTIYKNIKEYKNGNKEIFREIMNVFNPLINKLSKSVNGEDTRQDLLVGVESRKCGFHTLS